MEKYNHEFSSFTPLQAGDKVAVVSPAGDAASYFPWVLDQGLDRLRRHLRLEPIEYPTTRQRSPSPQDRARDLQEAFADIDIKAVFATLGGNDQLRILPYLDAGLVRNNPKPFFGYSDNTNFIQFLWNLGIPAYYGGAIMTQFAMQSGMHDLTLTSIKNAVFNKGLVELETAASFTDVDLDWADKQSLHLQRKMESNEGWHWDGSRNAEGRLWGGCVETLYQYLASGKPVPDTTDEKLIIFLESAENIPDAWVVNSLLSALGEREILHKASGVLVGRPKAWDFSKPYTPEQRSAYRREQRDTVITAVRKYNKTIPIIQNMDFGHTDPQIIVPSGMICRIDSAAKKVFFRY